MDKGDVARVGIVGLVLSAAGLIHIVNREGYSTQAYPDPVHGAAVPTVGYGSTGKDVKMGSVTTPQRALIRLQADADDMQVQLRRCMSANAPQPVTLYQWEWDAYVALAYNVGAGAVCYSNVSPRVDADRGLSTIVRKVQTQDYKGACEAILSYKYARGQDCSIPGNKTCPGIWQDRLKLRAMCLGAA